MTDTRRHTPAQHDDGQACLGCGQDWPCATERERRRIVDDWLASPEAERRFRAAGFEPDYNVCASCKHHGSKHDLNNVCLICGDRFGGMVEAEKWAHGLAALREQEAGK